MEHTNKVSNHYFYGPRTFRQSLNDDIIKDNNNIYKLFVHNLWVIVGDVTVYTRVKIHDLLDH